MTVTLYLRVLGHELRSYRAKGWAFVRYLWPLKGQYLIRKNVTDREQTHNQKRREKHAA